MVDLIKFKKRHCAKDALCVGVGTVGNLQIISFCFHLNFTQRLISFETGVAYMKHYETISFTVFVMLHDWGRHHWNYSFSFNSSIKIMSIPNSENRNTPTIFAKLAIWNLSIGCFTGWSLHSCCFCFCMRKWHVVNLVSWSMSCTGKMYRHKYLLISAK